jgi:hypothetical protein
MGAESARAQGRATCESHCRQPELRQLQPWCSRPSDNQKAAGSKPCCSSSALELHPPSPVPPCVSVLCGGQRHRRHRLRLEKKVCENGRARRVFGRMRLVAAFCTLCFLLGGGGGGQPAPSTSSSANEGGGAAAASESAGEADSEDWTGMAVRANTYVGMMYS